LPLECRRVTRFSSAQLGGSLDRELCRIKAKIAQQRALAHMPNQQDDRARRLNSCAITRQRAVHREDGHTACQCAASERVLTAPAQSSVVAHRGRPSVSRAICVNSTMLLSPPGQPRPANHAEKNTDNARACHPCQTRLHPRARCTVRAVHTCVALPEEEKSACCFFLGFSNFAAAENCLAGTLTQRARAHAHTSHVTSAHTRAHACVQRRSLGASGSGTDARERRPVKSRMV
jgi:hypothetical protein